MNIGVLTPDYFPSWDYFELILKSDMILILDDINIQRKSLVSRTKLIGQSGPEWFIVPILRNKSKNQKINISKTDESKFWRKDHIKKIRHSYGNSLYFEEIFPIVEDIINHKSDKIFELNLMFLEKLNIGLQLNRKILKLSDTLEYVNVEKLFDHLVEEYNCKNILLSETRNTFVPENIVLEKGIEIKKLNCITPEYQQDNTNKFEPGLSILDPLFNCGKQHVYHLLANSIKTT